MLNPERRLNPLRRYVRRSRASQRQVKRPEARRQAQAQRACSWRKPVSWSPSAASRGSTSSCRRPSLSPSDYAEGEGCGRWGLSDGRVRKATEVLGAQSLRKGWAFEIWRGAKRAA